MLPPAHLFASLSLGTTIMLLTNQLSWEGYIITILAGIAPDLDYIVYLIRREGQHHTTSHHTWFSHTLWPFVGIAFFLMLNGYNFLGILFIIGTTTHLIQDSIGTGDGIMWFYPFSRRQLGIHILGEIGKKWQQAYLSYWYFRWTERLSMGLFLLLSLWIISQLI